MDEINIPDFTGIEMDVLKIDQIDKAILSSILCKIDVAFKKRTLNEIKVIRPDVNPNCIPTNLKNDYSLSSCALKCLDYLPPSMRNSANIHKPSMLINTLCSILKFREPSVDFGSSKIRWENEEYAYQRISFKFQGYSISLSILEDIDHFYIMYWAYPEKLILERKISKVLVPVFINNKDCKYLNNRRFQILLLFCGWCIQSLKKSLKSVFETSRSKSSTSRSSSVEIPIPYVSYVVQPWLEHRKEPEDSIDALPEPENGGNGVSPKAQAT